MKKLALAAASLALVPAFISTAAFATTGSTGSLAGGSGLYNVRNVTTGSKFSSVASATCDQTVRYSVELSNTDYTTIKDITVKAPLSGDITVTGTDADGSATKSTGSVKVTVDKGTLTYDAGSTQIYDVNGKLLRTVDDTITTSGVNVGALAGSTREYVQFTATVKCDTTPTTPPTTPETPETPSTPETPTELPSTGMGDMILPAVAAAGVGAAAVYAVRGRRSIARLFAKN